MEVLETVLQILQILTTVVVMILVLLQSDNESKTGLSGVAESSSTMGMSRDKKLAKYTKVVGIAFLVLTIATSAVMIYNIK